MESKFIHLHNHMEGSLADATLRSKLAVKRAKELGMEAIALTDHGFMYNLINFYKDAEKEDIKPILGVETYVAPRTNLLKDANVDDANYHLVLLCETNEGYQNLIKICSNASLEGFYYKPRTDKRHLKMWSKGLIALSACLGGEVQKYILNDEYDHAKSIALHYNEIFGQGNFFLELQRHGMEEQIKVNEKLLQMSKETGIPVVATNDCHYLTRESFEAHDVLMAIQAKTTVDDTKRKAYPCDEFYLKSQEEMIELFKDVPEAIENTVKIAERCNVTIEFGVNKIPEYSPPKGYTSLEFLKEQIDKGVIERYGGYTDEIRERVDYEFSVVEQMNYTDYFLIMWDLFNFTREKDIFTGPGRGSAAGSILMYCLNVTQICPMKYGLLFERFLDPSRVSMPDVDSDFPDDRRAEVIEYIINKYGRDNICQIITFGTMAAKSAVRNVGRALALDKDADTLARLIPNSPGVKLKEAMDAEPDILVKYNTSENIKRIFDISIQLEGLPINASTHAAGVLIVDGKGLQEHVPLCNTEKGIVAQYAMKNLEDLGLLKLDALGLKQLTIIVDTIKQVKEIHGVDINPYDLFEGTDKNAFKIISDGYTEGIFQLEGSGMTSFMKELKPDSIEDIVAGVALYRPGPMDMIPQYIESKRDRSKVYYDFKELEPVFKETYGVMVYQEQCMKSAIVLAGYQKHHSDSLRKGIGKKIPEIIAQHRKWFINGREGNEYNYIPGGIRMNFPEKDLNMFYDKMEKFGKYSFNKSHAACYAVVAYATAWLKTYYPTEYMASLMTHNSKDHKKIYKYIQHCRKDLDIEIINPDINTSTSVFYTKEPGKISYTLFAKTVSLEILKKMIEDREKNGKYEDILSLIYRLQTILDKASFKALSAIGAFDSLKVKRSVLLASTDDIFSGLSKFKSALSRYNTNGSKRRKEAPDVSEWISYDESIFPNINEIPENVRLALEKEYLGIYLTGHPLNAYKCSIESYSTFNLNEMEYDIDDITGDINMRGSASNNQKIHAVVQISSLLKVFTKETKKPMAIIEFTDLTGSSKAIMFNTLYVQLQKYLKEDSIYKLTGTVQIRPDEEPIIIIDNLESIDTSLVKRVVFNSNSQDIFKSKAFLEHIRTLDIRGENPVYFKRSSFKVLLKKNYWVDIRRFIKNCNEEFLSSCSVEEW